MQGFFRYWTPDIKSFLRALSQAESEKESLLKSTLQRLIGRFCEYHTRWKQLVSATAGTHEPFCHVCAIRQLVPTPKWFLRLLTCCTVIKSINSNITKIIFLK